MTQRPNKHELAYCKKEDNPLQVSQAIHLDVVSFRKPADTNMLVSVCSNDELFIR